MHPSEFGLPHDSFRKGQLETVLFLLDEKRGKFSAVEAPTGSGKSAVGAALGGAGRAVRILTKTKSLQAQYRDYGAEVLYGVNNYDCVHMPPFKADFCAFPVQMFNCPDNEKCHYLIQREATKRSTKQSLSYPYYLQSKWVKRQQTDFLYCDEAHDLPEVIMDAATLEMDRAALRKADLPLWPMKVKVNAQPFWRKMIISWLENCRMDMAYEIAELEAIAKEDAHAARRKTSLERLSKRFSLISYGLQKHQESFYFKVTKDKLKIIPLTARLHFNDFFVHNMDHRLVLTSATIGNPAEFSQSLGIEDLDFRAVPSNFAPSEMPVIVPKDSPKMSHKSGRFAFIKQAQIISRLMKAENPDWSYLIHVSSIAQAKELATNLAKLGFEDRIWLPPMGVGTNKKLAAWKEELKKRHNLININWTFHEGIDAGKLANGNIIAKIPFGSLDDFGMAKMEYDKRYYRWRAAINTMQASGRIRRGEPEHYEVDGEPRRKLVAVVDGNVWSLMNVFSDHFKDCLYRT